MKKTTAFCFSVLLLLASCSGPKKSGLSEVELEEILLIEQRYEERAKYGSHANKVAVISDSAEVSKVREEILAKIESKKREESALVKNKSLAERYKSGDQTVVSQLVEAFKSDDDKLRKGLYNNLENTLDAPQDFTITEPELAEAILANIDNPDDEKSVVQLAGRLQLPGYVQKFEERLQSPQSTDRGRIFYWLGNDGTSLSSLQYVAGLLEQKSVTSDELDGILSGLQQFGENGNAEIQDLVGNIALKAYQANLVPEEEFKELKKNAYSSGAAEYLLASLFAYGNEEVIPIAQKFLKDGIREEAALKALIRLEGNEHKLLLLNYLKDKDKYLDFLDAAAQYYLQTKDESIPKEIVLQFEKNNENEQHQVDKLISTLLLMKAEKYLQNLNKLLTDQALISKIKESYELRKGKVEAIAKDMYSFGLIDSPLEESQLAKAKKHNKDVASAGPVYNLLNVSGIYLWFDAETGFVPVEYDKLIEEFAKNSKGKLKDMHVWMDTEESALPGEFIYKVTLLFNDKAYIIEPEDIGDWYDVELVKALLNKALAEAGVKEKFIFLETGDQTVEFLFGEEEKVKKFAEKYKL